MYEISITFTNGTKTNEIVRNFCASEETKCLETYEELANGDERTILYPFVNILKISIVVPKARKEEVE